jgi:ubiquinone/menaquinone biosynthesis C-methylase UbiE
MDEAVAVDVQSAPAGGYSRAYYLARVGPMFWVEVRHLMSLAAVETGERILELGCGGGDFLSACAERCRPSLIVGLDVNREATALARRLAPAAVVALADAVRLPFRDGVFHAVVAQHLIEHFERPDEVVREWSRVLRPGGRVAVATPNIMYPDPGLFDDPTHRQIYSRASLKGLFQRNGFSVERCYTVMPFLGNRRLTWTVARWFLRLLLAFRFLPYFRLRGLTLFLGARKVQDGVKA